jgi:hypothetical protein
VLEAGAGGERRLHGNFFYGERARRFVDHQRGDFAKQAAEFLRVRPLVAQAGEVVLDEWVRDDGDVFHNYFSNH